MLYTPLITPETRQLVGRIEAGDGLPTNEAVTALVQQLQTRCADSDIQARYATYDTADRQLETYPTDEAGYARAFDPLEEEQALFETWCRFGVVVAKGVVPEALCVGAVSKVHSTLRSLSGGTFAIDDSSTYHAMPVDAAGVPIVSRGFFEVYHDDALAQIRQAVRLYLHHVILWGRVDLWTTFDRLGVKLPGHTESVALPLHVDQNPIVHPTFKTTQGVLALEDCPAERGTLVVAPRSKQLFGAYGRMALNKGEYVELDRSDPVADEIAEHAQPLPLHRGHLASWDSRTTHANTTNISLQTRFIALISAGPARNDDSEAVMAREEAFQTGQGSNVRSALMHASKKPRYADAQALQAIRHPERLSLLGRLLYGQVAYDEIA